MSEETVLRSRESDWPLVVLLVASFATCGGCEVVDVLDRKYQRDARIEQQRVGLERARAKCPKGVQGE